MSRVRLGDLIDIITEHEDNPSQSKYDRFVGLEHYDAGEVVISRWGSTELLASAMKVFQPNDILVARRNVYLRRASVVNFAGLTSGDSIVIRAKDKDDEALLPFVLNTDSFWDFADRFADGTMSKRLSPKIMANFEFNMPSPDEKRRLAELLWAIHKTRVAYKELLQKTDDLVKSQFIEMFGDPLTNPHGLSKRPLCEVASIASGITKGRKTKATELHSVPYICTANVQDGYIDWSETKYIDASDDEIRQYALEEDDILMIEGGDPDKVGRGHLAGIVPENCIYQNHVFRVRMDRDEVLPEFMAAYITLPRTKEYFLACAKQTTGIATINKRQLSELQVVYPNLQQQAQYIDLIHQADKSKLSLIKRLEELKFPIE